MKSTLLKAIVCAAVAAGLAGCGSKANTDPATQVLPTRDPAAVAADRAAAGSASRPAGGTNGAKPLPVPVQ